MQCQKCTLLYADHFKACPVCGEARPGQDREGAMKPDDATALQRLLLNQKLMKREAGEPEGEGEPSPEPWITPGERKIKQLKAWILEQKKIVQARHVAIKQASKDEASKKEVEAHRIKLLATQHELGDTVRTLKNADRGGYFAEAWLEEHNIYAFLPTLFFVDAPPGPNPMHGEDEKKVPDSPPAEPEGEGQPSPARNSSHDAAHSRKMKQLRAWILEQKSIIHARLVAIRKSNNDDRKAHGMKLQATQHELSDSVRTLKNGDPCGEAWLQIHKIYDFLPLHAADALPRLNPGAPIHDEDEMKVPDSPPSEPFSKEFLRSSRGFLQTKLQQLEREALKLKEQMKLQHERERASQPRLVRPAKPSSSDDGAFPCLFPVSDDRERASQSRLLRPARASYPDDGLGDCKEPDSEDEADQAPSALVSRIDNLLDQLRKL